MQAIAVHSYIYGEMLKNNEIQFFKPSDNSLQIPTYKGMACIVDDNLTTATAGVYVTILFGPGAVGFAVAPPRTGFGTEIWRIPNAPDHKAERVRTSTAITKQNQASSSDGIIYAIKPLCMRASGLFV